MYNTQVSGYSVFSSVTSSRWDIVLWWDQRRSDDASRRWRSGYLLSAICLICRYHRSRYHTVAAERLCDKYVTSFGFLCEENWKSPLIIFVRFPRYKSPLGCPWDVRTSGKHTGMHGVRVQNRDGQSRWNNRILESMFTGVRGYRWKNQRDLEVNR